MTPKKDESAGGPNKSSGKNDIAADSYLAMDDKVIEKIFVSPETENSIPHPMEINWKQTIYFGVLHVIFFNELYKLLTGYYTFSQFIQMYAFGYLTAMFGIAGGHHRLWAHRSYKVKLPLKIILIFLSTISGQLSIYTWSRIHRIHHKFTETDADPHNIKNGFFFAHIGWLLVHRHPEVERKGKTVDMSDLQADPWVMFQHKYYHYVSQIFVFILPTLLFQYLWGTPFWDTFCLCGVFRYLFTIHFVSLTNSYAHYFGTKPYDRRMSAVNGPGLGFITDERWHNYHHVFPWDYRSNEFNSYHQNLIKLFIDFFAWVGWAYDMKTVDPEMIKSRVLRTGDGSHPVWGWGDKDTTEEDIKATVTINAKKDA